jgi:ParB family chromosome partitioning protein
MTRLRDYAESKRDILMIDPRLIVVEDGYNVRDLTTADAQTKLMVLARSIAEFGFSSEHPVTVRLDADKIVLVAGHRRRAATMMAIDDLGAEILAIPCIPEARGTSEADRCADLIMSNSGEPLTALETASVIKRLLGFGWTTDAVAKRLGWESKQTAENHLALLEAAPAVREMVRTGEVSATTAVNVTRKHGADAEATLIKAKGHATGAGKKRVTAAHVAAATGEFQANAANAKTLVSALHQIVDDGDDFSSLLAEETLRSVGALKPGAAARQHIATTEAAAE